MADFAFWFIQIPGWGLFIYLLAVQCSSAISYDFGVRMGTQEPEEQVTQVGVAFWKGLAMADLLFYTPVLGAGLAGHWAGTAWGTPALSAALGITVYWPLACLVTIRAARDAQGWHLPKERQYGIVLPAIAGWGLIAMALLIAAP